MARALGEPVCVPGRRYGSSTLRMRFEVDRDLAGRVALRYRPSASHETSVTGKPARVWRDNHVVAGVELPLQLCEKQRLELELWSAGQEPRRLWRRDVLIERLDREQGLHHLCLMP